MTDTLKADDQSLTWLEEDRLHEECGVFGIFGHPDAAALTALGLHALQHRGQEAAGIVTFDGHHFHTERRLGLVGDHFTSRPGDRPAEGRRGHRPCALFDLRRPDHAQRAAAVRRPRLGGFALAHNGNLTNALTMRDWLITKGAICQSTTDTEVILHLVARSEKRLFVEKFIEALLQIEGAYALVGLTNKKLVGARDPFGIRPLVLGRLGEAWVLASETCALDIIGADFVREVENGEVVVITEEGLESHRFVPKYPARLCIFEYIYFARPNSMVGGRSVYEVRKEMGRQLALEAPADADVVVPIPNSGVPAAIGYSQGSGIPFEYGIIRNHYVGRTFIEPEQRIRQLGVKLKHSANEAQVRGKRIVLIDDSVVRGTTSVKIVQMMREAGAKEIHMRISSPPITHPDFYGIDTPDQDKLLAATKTLEEMRAYMGADTLAFLSVDGIYKAMGYEGRDAAHPQFTDHCFTGEYPTRLRDREGPPQQKQLSFLAEVG